MIYILDLKYRKQINHAMVLLMCITLFSYFNFLFCTMPWKVNENEQDISFFVQHEI